MFKSRNQLPPSYNSLFANNKNTDNNKNVIQMEQKLNEPISYELFMKTRKHLVQEQTNPQSNLQNYLPIKYIIIHLIILTFLSLILIGLQIVVIERNQSFAYIGSGIWMGAYNLILIFYALLQFDLFFIQVKHQKRILILIIENMHIIGCILTLGAIIGLNSIIIMNSTCQQKSSCSYNTSINPDNNNNNNNNSYNHQSDININILFISIGVICVILYIAFFICIECTFKSNLTSSTNGRQVYPMETN